MSTRETGYENDILVQSKKSKEFRSRDSLGIPFYMLRVRFGFASGPLRVLPIADPIRMCLGCGAKAKRCKREPKGCSKDVQSCSKDIQSGLKRFKLVQCGSMVVQSLLCSKPTGFNIVVINKFKITRFPQK